MKEIDHLQQENEILKENAEHNDKVVDKVNWENMLLKKENQELKKQLEEINYTIIPNCDIKPLIDKFRTQQKTFIKWLEDEIKRINPDNLSISELINSELDNIKLTRYLTYKESLQKYKEITEEIDNE